MKQLIRIQEQNGQRLVDARELHVFLNVETKYAEWINRRIKKYGFIENQDYVSFTKNLVKLLNQKKEAGTY